MGLSTCLGEGDPFCAALLVAEEGLLHVWELGHVEVLCASNCKDVVDLLSCNIGVLCAHSLA